MNTKPDYITLGYASKMGSKLKTLVEQQLLQDIKNYDFYEVDLKFDWSESVIEGHYSEYLDGSVENFSGICLYNSDNELIAEGWMDFVHEQDFFVAYWDHLVFMNHHPKEKTEFGVPKHIVSMLPRNI